MEFSTILIKYSTDAAIPASLMRGELAYSEQSGKLFIGSDASLPVYIGGAELIAQFGSLDTLVTAINARLTTAEGTIGDLVADLATAISERVTEDTRLQGEITRVENMLSVAAQGLDGRVGALETFKTTQEGINSDIETRVSANTSGLIATDATVEANRQTTETEIARVDQAIADINNNIGTGLGNRVTAIEAEQDVQDGEIARAHSRIDGVDNLLNSGSPTFTNLTVTGELIVNGGLTKIESTTTTIKDPVINLGEDSGGFNDGMDRGVSFTYHDPVSGSAKTGFFGMDAADGKFKFLPDATAVAANSFDPAAGSAPGVIVGNVEGSATSLATARNITLGGEASGSVTFDGSSDVTLNVTVAAASAATPEVLVRRDVDGSAEFAAVKTTAKSVMSGGIHGANPSGTKSALTGFVINGGSF